MPFRSNAAISCSGWSRGKPAKHCLLRWESGVSSNPELHERWACYRAPGTWKLSSVVNGKKKQTISSYYFLKLSLKIDEHDLSSAEVPHCVSLSVKLCYQPSQHVVCHQLAMIFSSSFLSVVKLVNSVFSTGQHFFS